MNHNGSDYDDNGDDVDGEYDGISMARMALLRSSPWPCVSLGGDGDGHDDDLRHCVATVWLKREKNATAGGRRIVLRSAAGIYHYDEDYDDDDDNEDHDDDDDDEEEDDCCWSDMFCISIHIHTLKFGSPTHIYKF